MYFKRLKHNVTQPFSGPVFLTLLYGLIHFLMKKNPDWYQANELGLKFFVEVVQSFGEW